MDEVVEFSSQHVAELRRAAGHIHHRLAKSAEQELCEEVEERGVSDRGRWRKLVSEPAELLAAFPSLTLRQGCELRAYYYNDFYAGVASVFAAEADADFPDPEDTWEPPHGPPGVGTHQAFMDAIAGDGSPQSFMEASLFVREARELGARWHAVDWLAESVLAEDPWRSGTLIEGEPLSPRENWSWMLDQPSSWRPTAILFERGSASVRFFSHSPIAVQRIHANVDLYAGHDPVGGIYSRVPIASGPSGWIP